MKTENEGTIIKMLQRWFQYRVENEKIGHVLLVSPITPFSQNTRDLLRSYDLAVLEAENASDAIEILEAQKETARLSDLSEPESLSTESKDAQRVDLVMVWNNLEDLSGIDLIRFIRSRPYDPAVILVDAADEVVNVEGSAVSDTPQVGMEGRTNPEVVFARDLGISDYFFLDERTKEGLERETVALASRAKKCWEDALVGRIRKQMVIDLRAILLSSVPQGNTRLAKELDGRIASASEVVASTKRVLLAEGEPETRKALQHALQKLEIDVETTTGPKSALLLLRDDPPNLLIVDPAESELDETEFLEMAEEVSPGVDIVILTQDPTPALAREAFRLNVTDLIRKPIRNPETVAQRILFHMDAKRRNHAEELLIVELYEMAREYAAEGRGSTSLTEQLFSGIIDKVERTPESIPKPSSLKPSAGASQDKLPSSQSVKTEKTAKHTSGKPDPNQRHSTIELMSGEYEVIKDNSGKSSNQTPLQNGKGTKPMELVSGEYEIVSRDEAFVSERSRLPDLAILKYIDRVLFSRQSMTPGGGKEDKLMGRRHLPRVEKSFLVTYETHDSAQSSLGFNKDLSLGGMFISAENPLPRGKEVTLKIQVVLKDEVHRFSCQGKVVWNTYDDEDKLEIFGPGFGVEFTVLDARGSEIIRKVIAESS